MIKTIYEQAISKFGINAQKDMLIEEMAELTQALLKNRRKPNNFTVLENLHEEFADVEIMMTQIKTTLNLSKLEDYKSDKLDQLKRLVDDKKIDVEIIMEKDLENIERNGYSNNG